MNLNYEEFKEKIKEDIKDYMDEKYKEMCIRDRLRGIHWINAP